jgi:hypothetical protein
MQRCIFQFRLDGLTPTVALISAIEIVPSSTRTPFGSVTVIVLASGASVKSVTWPVTVTFVGETERVEPLIGFVLTKVFADAVLAPKNARSTTTATRKRFTSTFQEHFGSAQFAPIVSLLYT